MVPKTDAGWQRLLHVAAVQITEARAAGNQSAEIHYRKEFQRLTLLHAQWIAGQAIRDTEATLRDYVPSLPQLAFAGGMAVPLAVLGAVLLLGRR